MKYTKDYVTELKECKTQEDVWNLMKGRTFRGSDNSKFEDNIIYLPRSSGHFSGVTIGIENKLYDLALRLIIYLKLDGEISDIPRNSGKSAYARHLWFLFNNMTILYPDINSLNDLEGDVLDYLIDRHAKSENDLVSTTLGTKIGRLKEWIIFVNHKLPFFLQLNESIFLDSKKYLGFLEETQARKRNSPIIGGPKKPYPLSEIKYLVGESMSYLEKYSEDCLLAAQVYIDVRDMDSNYKKYPYVFDYFKSTSYKFAEPTLKDFQINCQNNTARCVVIDGKTVRSVTGGLVEGCISAAKRLEGACIVIILFLTGMRSHELTRLERYPVVEQGEHLNFKRLIYKTASIESGEELVIPIPPIVKTALEMLSRISEIKDGCKDGPIVLSDFRFSDGGGTDSRLQASVNYFSKHIELDNPPNPHEFRHAIAFLIVYLNDKDGLDLARMFLGHTSIIMTLQYMAHFNPLIKEAIREMYEEGSKQLVGSIVKELEEGRELRGIQGKRLMGNLEFIGSYHETFTELLTKSMMALIEKGQCLIIETPVCICFHDLSKVNEMSCQRGFGITNFTGVAPIPSRCEGGSCGNAIFTETKIEELDNKEIDPDLKRRLMQNIHFVSEEGFDVIDPFEKIIEEYRKSKRKVG